MTEVRGSHLNEPTINVAVICTGNICRSPMAEVVLCRLIADDPFLDGHVLVTSAGTANWHVGAAMDPRARSALDRAGFTSPATPGAYADRRYLNAHDVVVVMTREHVHEVRRRLDNPLTQVLMLRNLLDPGSDLDVADPYYGNDDDFDECLDMIIRASERLTLEFRRRLGGGSPGA